MTRQQAAIIATMDEIAQTQQKLGIPADPDDMAEAWFIVEQIELKFQKAKAEG